MRLYSEVTVKKIVKDVLIELLKDKEYEPMLYTKMCDKIKDYPTANPWHTGTPTEEGWYLIQTKRVDVDTGRYIFKVGNLSDVLWFQSEGYKELSCYGIVAWQKIEPYKENEDGRTD